MKADHHIAARVLQAMPFLTALARTGSFTAAGAALGVDQSAVSHRIRQLETLLGTALFDREGRVAVPTAAGRSLVALSNGTLRGVDAALRELAAGDAREVLTVSMSATLANLWGMAALPAVTPHGMGLEIIADERLSDLGLNASDMAIRFGIGPYEGLETIELSSVTLTPMAATRDLDLADPDAVLIQDRSCDQDGTQSGWDRYEDASGLSLSRNPRMSVTRTDMAIQAALAGHGIALGRPLLTDAAAAAGRLVAVGKPVDCPSRYWICFRRNDPRRDLLRDMAEALCSLPRPLPAARSS